MSRDWAPWEHLAAEKDNIENGRGTIWDFLERITVRYLDGKSERLCSDEELACRKEFPLLGKLLSNAFVPLYEKLSNIEGGIELLHSKDQELANYIETGKGDINAPVIKWFRGELDPCFYYSERNHKLFAHSVLEEARGVSAELNSMYEAYKQNWYKDHGVSPEKIADFKKEYADDVSAGKFDGSFEDYEQAFGYYRGEVYACFAEFMDCEFALWRLREEPSLDRVLASAEGRSNETLDNAHGDGVKRDFEKEY